MTTLHLSRIRIQDPKESCLLLKEAAQDNEKETVRVISYQYSFNTESYKFVFISVWVPGIFGFVHYHFTLTPYLLLREAAQDNAAAKMSEAMRRRVCKKILPT